MNWIWNKYHDLDDSQLRNISELRKSFFEADQKDPVKDEYDEMSFHLLGLIDSDLVAYGRVIPPHGEFINPYLSRIIVAEKFRKKGFGKALVNELSKKSLFLTRPNLKHYKRNRLELVRSSMELFDAIQDKIIRPVIGKRYEGLENVANAHTDIETRRIIGSAVITLN